MYLYTATISAFLFAFIAIKFFRPVRDHSHHILERQGLYSSQTLTLIPIVSVMFFLVGIIGKDFE